MKKILAIASCAALLCCLALAACSSKSSEEGSNGANLENPWTDCTSVAEAEDASGVEFEANEAPETSLGAPTGMTYRAMLNLVEVTYEYPAAQVVVRKGIADPNDDAGISGDYNEYAEGWSVDIDGLEVQCSGNVADKAIKATWSYKDYDYSVMAVAGGGDEDFGLSAEDLAAFCAAVK